MTLGAGAAANGPRSFADLHAHSRGSFDSLSDPRAMVERAMRLGLTHLAITDHERIEEAQWAVTVAADLGTAEGRLTVIVGEEIRTRDGDLIGLFLERAVPPGLSASETSVAVREQGGLVGLPHPFDGFRSSGGSRTGGTEARLDALAGLVDYVEAHNARAYGDANAKAAAYAARHQLPVVASSDAHSLMELGIASTSLPGAFSSAEELRALLSSTSLLPGRASYYVRLWTPVAKVVQRVRGRGRIRPEVSSPAREHP